MMLSIVLDDKLFNTLRTRNTFLGNYWFSTSGHNINNRNLYKKKKVILDKTSYDEYDVCKLFELLNMVGQKCRNNQVILVG